MSDYLDANGLQRVWGKFKENISSYKEIENVDIASFDDGSNLPMPKLEVAIEPQQDLHGYDAPWVGGAGKNKLQITATTQTLNGVTFTVNSDGTVSLSGTATGTFVFPLISGNLSFTSDTIITGGYAEASASKVALRINGSNLVPSEGYTISANTNITEIAIRVNSEFNTNGIKVYPMIRLASVTDATFAPYSNECPISGWDEANVVRCGKNHFDKITFTVKKFLTSDGRIETSDNWSISDYIGVKGGTAYILSGVTNAGTAAYHCFYDKDKNFISSVISTTQNFTTPSNAVYVRISMRTETPDAVQFEYGNTATAYEPYNPNSTIYTIDLDGTRYGGKLDIVSGVLTVDRAYKDLGTLSWGNQGTANTYQATISDMLTPSNNIICSNYPTVDASTTGGNMPDKSIKTYGNSSAKYIIVKDSSYATYSEFQTAMSGVQLVYELATPIEVQLTPTIIKSLQGDNNFFADSGEIIRVEYQPDNIVGELRKDIADVKKVHTVKITDYDDINHTATLDKSVRQIMSLLSNGEYVVVDTNGLWVELDVNYYLRPLEMGAVTVTFNLDNIFESPAPTPFSYGQTVTFSYIDSYQLYCELPYLGDDEYGDTNEVECRLARYTAF